MKTFIFIFSTVLVSVSAGFEGGGGGGHTMMVYISKCIVYVWW